MTVASTGRPAYWQHRARPFSAWWDRLVALGVAAAAVSVYLNTIYPGLTEIGDASKFAFVGRILGTPHAPGYPLYVWTSHLFSYVPWGSLAYRMNALSALWAGVAAGLGYLIARGLGVRPVVAASTALALAFGDAFWSRALYAKVYTLQAALVSAGILALITWSRTKRRRDLFLAVMAFSLSLGNHLTVLALLPVLALFVLLVDWRQALRPTTLVVVATMAAAGFAQYLLIVIRTRQGAPYLEASARNLSELWTVMTARRFALEIGAFSWSALVSERVPLVWNLIATELGVIGVLVYLLGLGTLLQRRWRVGLLLGLGALGIAGLTANMSSDEDEGFLLSVFVLSWPVVAVGFERALGLLGYGARAPFLRHAIPVLALLLPLHLLNRNYSSNDHHDETFETAYFDALFSVLPDRSVIVNDEYRFNMMVLYKLHGERAGADRGIALAAAEPRNLGLRMDLGQPVFAFEHARAELAQYGLHFVPAAFQAPPDLQPVLRGRSIFRLASMSSCFDIGNTGWTDVSRALQPKGRWSVKIDNYRPFDTTVTLYAGAATPPTPRLFIGRGAGSPAMQTEHFTTRASDVSRLQARLAADTVTLPEAILSAPVVSRSEIRVNDRGAFLVIGVDEGAPVIGAVARAVVDLNNPRRATLCSHPVGNVDAWPAGQRRVTITADSGLVEFGGGWHGLEHRDGDGLPFRWMSDTASVVVPIETPRKTLVHVNAEPLDYPGRHDGTMALAVNGHRFDQKRLPSERTTLTWLVPAVHWRAGLNEVLLEVAGARRPADVIESKDMRVLGASIPDLELEDADTPSVR